VRDWSLPDRGLLKGEALQNFVNRAVGNRPLEKLDRLVAIVATDLQSGEATVFRTGNTGMAVRASSSVPGVFQPVSINGRDYVDGGLVSPIPVRAARALGGDLVIAVDISAKPENGKTQNTVGVLLQTFAIMGRRIGRYELAEADVVIQPQLGQVAATDFKSRDLAVLEGEKAAAAALPEIRRRLALFAQAHGQIPAQAQTQQIQARR
jgi:NTE family protein